MPVQKTDNGSNPLILTQEQKQLVLDEITQISERIANMSSRVLILENNNSSIEQNNTNIKQELLQAEREITEIHEDLHVLNLETESQSNSLDKISQEIAQCKLDQENVEKLSKKVKFEQQEIKTDQNRLLQGYKELGNDLERISHELAEINQRVIQQQELMENISLDFDDIANDQEQLSSGFQEISKHQQKLRSEFEELSSESHPLNVRAEKHFKEQDRLLSEFEEIISGRHPLMVMAEKHFKEQDRLISEFEEIASGRHPLMVMAEKHFKEQARLISEFEEIASGRHPLTVRAEKNLQDYQRLLSKGEEILSGRHPLMVRTEELLKKQDRLLSKGEEILSGRHPLMVRTEELLKKQDRLLSEGEEILSARKDMDGNVIGIPDAIADFDLSTTRFNQSNNISRRRQFVASQTSYNGFSPFYGIDQIHSNTSYSFTNTKKIEDNVDDQIDDPDVILFFENYKRLATELDDTLEKSKVYLKRLEDTVEDSFRISLFNESEPTDLTYSKESKQLKELKVEDDIASSEDLINTQKVNNHNDLKFEGHPLHSLLKNSLSLEKFYEEIYLRMIALESNIQYKSNSSFIDLSKEIKGWCSEISLMVKDIETALENEELTDFEIEKKKLHYEEIIMQMSLSRSDYASRLDEVEKEYADLYNETTTEPVAIIEETALAVPAKKIPLIKKIKKIFLNFFRYFSCFIRNRDLSGYKAKVIKTNSSVADRFTVLE